jgi:hypothetical protein
MCHVILPQLKKWQMIIQKTLPILYLYIETKRKPYECNTCSNVESTRFDKVVPIIMNFNFIQIYK